MFVGKHRTKKLVIKYKPTIIPEQIAPFLESYYKHMAKLPIIDVATQEKIRSLITNLTANETESTINSDSSSSGDSQSPQSSISSGRQSADEGLSSDHGLVDLTGARKLEFLIEVWRDLLRILSSDCLSPPLRTQVAESLCYYSEIPSSTFRRWFFPA